MENSIGIKHVGHDAVMKIRSLITRCDIYSLSLMYFSSTMPTYIMKVAELNGPQNLP